MRRVAALLVLVAGLAITLGQPAPALGHAALRSSDPAANAFLPRAPGQITLAFTEPLEPRSSSIELLDASGRAVGIPMASVSGATMTVALPQLKAGIYNVLWANVSRIDGHAIRGSFPFTVLNTDGSVPDQANTVGGLSTDPDAPPLADGAAVRALSLLGLALVVAGAVITLLWKAPDVAVRRGLLLAAYCGAVVLLAATLLSFVTIRDTYSGVPARDLVFETSSGGYWLTRLGLVLLIAVAASFASEAPRRTAAALVGCVALYLWAFTATSHAAAGAGSSWAKALDIGHGVAALGWIGAVVGLAVAARLGSRESDWKSLVPRFSLFASSMVFVLLATGTLGAFVEIEKVSKLWETRYGVTLLVKLGLIVPLLAVAGYNARWAKERLSAGTEREPRRFLLTATAEVALGMAVFLAAAMLTQTTVSKSVAILPEARPFDQTTTVGDLRVQLKVDPNQTGLNTYRIQMSDAAGNRVAAQRVRLTFRYQEDGSIGASMLTLAASDSGAFVGQGPFMTLEGRWRVEVEVRRADADDLIGFFDVRPAGAAVVGPTDAGAWSNPAPGLTWNQFGGMVFVLAGLGFALARTPLRSFGREAGWAANGMTMAGVSVGVLLLFGVHAHDDRGVPVNPITPDADSISQGRTIFEQNCAVCHGRTGVPPKGLDLNPYPLDLTVHVPQHADGVLFNFINGGVPGSAMRAWGQGDGSLSEEQIWHIVNFLRTLTPVDR